MNDPLKADMSWQDEQERTWGVIDRRLSPAHPVCALCGFEVVNKSHIGWIDLGGGADDPRQMPRVAVHLDCCGMMSARHLMRVALEAIPAAARGSTLLPHPGPIRVGGRMM